MNTLMIVLSVYALITIGGIVSAYQIKQWRDDKDTRTTIFKYYALWPWFICVDVLILIGVIPMVVRCITIRVAQWLNS